MQTPAMSVAIGTYAGQVTIVRQNRLQAQRRSN